MPDYTYMAKRQKKSVGLASVAIQILAVCFAVAICLYAWRDGFHRLARPMPTGDISVERYFIEKTCMGARYWPGWPVNPNSIQFSLGTFAPSIPQLAVYRVSCLLSTKLPMNSLQVFLAIGITLTLTTGYLACRLASISQFSSLFCALSLCLAPSSFSRFGHLPLSQLWPVLPSVACSVAILSIRIDENVESKLVILKHFCIGLLFGVLAFTSQEYYAVFGSVLVASAMSWRTLGPKGYWPIESESGKLANQKVRFASLAIGLGFIGINLSVLASKYFLWHIPKWAIEATTRLPSEQFSYGFWPLTLFQSPIYRQELFSALQSAGLHMNETPFGSQGSLLIVIAALLSIKLFSHRPESEKQQSCYSLRKASSTVFLISLIICLLCTTPGSLGTLFAVLVSPQLRALNRFLPYVYGPAVLIVALWVEQRMNRAWLIMKMQ